MVEIRDVTWEALPGIEVPPVQLQQSAWPEVAGAPEPERTSEPGGPSEPGETPEPGGLNDLDSGPLTPLPLLRKETPHQRRATPSARSVGHGGKGERGSVGGENLRAPDTATAPQYVYLLTERNETSAHGDISVEASETSSSGESRPVPTMVRTAERQLESNFLGPGNGEELGRTRAQTRALDREAAGLVSMFGPDEGGKLIHGLLAVQVTRKPGELPKCLVREAGPEPVPYHASCSSQYSGVWMEAMRMEVDELVAAGTFAEHSTLAILSNLSSSFPPSSSGFIIPKIKHIISFFLRHTAKGSKLSRHQLGTVVSTPPSVQLCPLNTGCMFMCVRFCMDHICVSRVCCDRHTKRPRRAMDCFCSKPTHPRSHEISIQQQYIISSATTAVFQALTFAQMVTVYVCMVGAQQKIEQRQHYLV